MMTSYFWLCHFGSFFFYPKTKLQQVISFTAGVFKATQTKGYCNPTASSAGELDVSVTSLSLPGLLKGGCDWAMAGARSQPSLPPGPPERERLPAAPSTCGRSRGQ